MTFSLTHYIVKISSLLDNLYTQKIYLNCRRDSNQQPSDLVLRWQTKVISGIDIYWSPILVPQVYTC